MKKLDVIQLTLIIIGLLVLYNAIPIAIQFLSYGFMWFYEGLKGGDYMFGFIETILFLAFYLIFSIYIINNSKKIASAKINKAQLNSEININLNKTELLYTVFIAIGLYGMIVNLPSFVRDSYFLIKKSNSDLNSIDAERVTASILFTKGFTIGLFFILLYYADVFSEFLSKKINNKEEVDSIGDASEIN